MDTYSVVQGRGLVKVVQIQEKNCFSLLLILSGFYGSLSFSHHILSRYNHGFFLKGEKGSGIFVEIIDMFHYKKIIAFF